MTLKYTQDQTKGCVCVCVIGVYLHVSLQIGHIRIFRDALKSMKHQGKFRKENLLSFPKYELSALLLHKVIGKTKRIHHFLVFFQPWSTEIMKLPI